MPYPVPEQSAELMKSFSGGQTFVEDSYLFLFGEDWLMAIGYPEEGEASEKRFDAALRTAIQTTGAIDVFAIAPSFPERLRPHVMDTDTYWILPSNAPIPTKLRGPVRHAAERLTVSESRCFTAGHRQLWAEFMNRVALPPRVRRLYALTEQGLHGSADLRLLDAHDAQGNLAESLLLDYSLPQVVSYIIGAQSRTHYTPHAADLLFAEMLKRAQAERKSVINLGLGVNEGILRFKKKWGAVCAQPYQLASWREEIHFSRQLATSLTQTLLSTPSGLSKRQIFEMLPEQRPHAMLWKLEKGGRVSWIGGAAHFFCCSFEHSLERLFQHVDTVLVEGPIDQESLDEVARHGRSPEPGAPRAGHFLAEREIRALEKIVRGPSGPLARLLNMTAANPADVRYLLFETRPWYAFFSLWTAFLERHGWTQSVDMEVWNLAQDMGKTLLGMESLAEQITSLESAPLPRIVNFLKSSAEWPRRMRRNRAAYLAGDLNAMMGTTAEFPTRTEAVIGKRDQRFRERMRPYIERGGTAVFVGTAHMQNLRPMLAEDGFTVTRVLPTLKHRLRVFLTKDTTVVLPGNPNASSIATETSASGHALQTPLQPMMAPAAGPGSGETLRGLSAQALVPEQLAAYVQSVSQNHLKNCEGFALWSSGEDAILVGYPADGEKSDEAVFRDRLNKAVASALRLPDLRRITILAPCRPEHAPASATVVDGDSWWFMDLPFTPGQKLRNMLRRANRDIAITQESWNSEHAALVDTYLKTRTLHPGTRQIFSRLGNYLQDAHDTVLFAARTADGSLTALSVGDYSALRTAFYMFAFRRPDSPPGTSDALLDALIREAVQRGHSQLNLGLGINDGIGFFKKKWNARPAMPYVETSWAIAPR